MQENKLIHKEEKSSIDKPKTNPKYIVEKTYMLSSTKKILEIDALS